MSSQHTSDDAIACALKQDWPEAIRINLLLLEQDNTNIDTLNRLGFAYMSSGQITQSKKTYQRVIELDEYNQIALKNLKKLSTVKQKDLISSASGPLSPMMFLEEPGRTKIAGCVNLAPGNIIATLYSGEEVFLKAKKHCVELRDEKNTYLGALPDDLSFKLIKFIEGGNQYRAFVKSVGKNALIVFIREVARGKHFANQPSFISVSSYSPYARSEDTYTEKPDTTPTGEDTEETEPEHTEE